MYILTYILYILKYFIFYIFDSKYIDIDKFVNWNLVDTQWQ